MGLSAVNDLYRAGRTRTKRMSLADLDIWNKSLILIAHSHSRISMEEYTTYI